jgi:hypothetical protein
MSRCLPSKIDRSADPESVMQKGSRCFDVWDLYRPNTSKFSHHTKGWTLKKRKISVTDCVGALMDLTIPRNAGYNGYIVWRKPRPDILRY